MLRVSIPLALFCLLASCATLSEDQCRSGDWRSIGFTDGSRGRTAEFLGNHAEACAAYDIRPQQSLWEEGRQAGLKIYCTPSEAYSEGRRGRILKSVCPAADEAVLRQANRRGLALHRIEQEISSLERDIWAIERAIANLGADDTDRAWLISERARLRLDLLSLRTRRNLYL